MKIKIKETTTWDLIKPLAGQWIEVETDHLFTNQYNTVPFDGCENGARIMDTDVEKVINDARVGKGKCGYCASMLNTGEVCNETDECKHFKIEWFTKENTYFLSQLPENSIRFIHRED